MNKVLDSDIGISEYDFTKRLFDLFGFAGLEDEIYYIDAWLKQCKKQGEQYVSPAYEELPYKDGFGEAGDDEFEFIHTKRFTKVGTSKKNKVEDESFWLLSSKANKALNTQFKRNNKVQIHPGSGYLEGEKVLLTSDFGELELEVVLNVDLRTNCVVVTSNTLGLNILTPSIVSEEGENACYQDVKIIIEKV
jgi:hypothetical protein